MNQILSFPIAFVESGKTIITDQPYKLLVLLGMILILAKLFSLALSKLKVPQVIGFLISGLVVGLISLIPNDPFLLEGYGGVGLDFFAKVGVVLIMFSAGLETDLKKVKSMGVSSFVITSLGVLVPLLFGFLAAFVVDKMTYNADTEMGLLDMKGILPIYSEIYYGVILSATSVSITVATLKELGKLDTPVGTSLVSAAILDDIIGIVLLSLIISLAATGSAEATDKATFAGMITSAGNITSIPLNIFLILLFMVLFFVVSWLLGKIFRKLFNYLGNKYPHHIRITILALGFCFIWSYIAEYFSIADITGAYLMGLMLSETTTRGYIDHRSETISGNVFAPVFFANIALNMYSGIQFNTTFLIFGIIWIVCGLLGKVIGAGSGALICHFKFKDSLRIGVGMMARAEVLIVCAQKGIDTKLINDQIMVYTLMLILISSFMTPILLKILYKDENGDTPASLPHDKPSDAPAVTASKDTTAFITPVQK
jgi:Kef-type K+ transport system membrane component KefB